MELRLNTMDSLRVQVRPFGEMNTPGNTCAGNSSASCGEPIETAAHKGSASLTNQEIARIVAWSTENVEHIRRTYVDDAAIVVALGERISNGLL